MWEMHGFNLHFSSSPYLVVLVSLCSKKGVKRPISVYEGFYKSIMTVQEARTLDFEDDTYWCLRKSSHIFGPRHCLILQFSLLHVAFFALFILLFVAINFLSILL